MTVKEIRRYLFSGAMVKLVYDNKSVFQGNANELPLCAYSNYEVKPYGVSSILSDNTIRINISNPAIEIPNEFDSYEVPTSYQDRMINNKIPIHVRIVDSIIHHYTNEKFYSISIETMGLFGNYPEIKSEFVSEKDLLAMYRLGKG